MRWTIVAAAALFSSSVIGLASPAGAEEEFSVTVTGGKITVVTKGNWHINKDYPWRMTIGDTKIDKSKFAITDTSASVASAPSGQGKIKGAVCSGDACKTIEKDVTIP